MAYIYDLTDTWNAGGTTFNAIKMNVTDSASAAGSKLVTLQTNGTEHFSVTKAGVGYFSGNVGIGTSSPTAYSGYTSLEIDNASNGGILSIKKAGSLVGYLNGSIGLLLLAQDNDLKLTTTGSTSMLFSTNSTERMRIDASGNVGVGTQTPGNKLHVVGGQINAVADDAYGAAFNATTGNCRVIPYSSAYSGTAIVAYSAGYAGNGPLAIDASQTRFLISGTERMRITSAGNVGIGTSSPGVQLQINGSQPQIQWSNPTTGATSNDGTHLYLSISDFWLVNKEAAAMVFATDNTERARIDSSGNLLVGTTTTATGYKLFVAGDVRISNAGAETGALQISQESTQALIQTRYSQPLIFGTAATERARIDSSGNLLVGTTNSDPSGGNVDGAAIGSASGNYISITRSAQVVGTFNLKGVTGDMFRFNYNGGVVGTIGITTTTTSYNTSSDYRLKDIDGPITNSGAYIDALKPVQGSWKADGSRFIGLLAHEVQEVSETPIATGEKDGEEMQAMDYSAPEIIANLIAEIQSLRARVAQLEGN